ncbi:MAG: hypothetical protein U5L95_03735 [Candidatus Saccharibacteria bacterium]|nr:hypothetical protein [Candidatus Saccharibacteria bacterium]
MSFPADTFKYHLPQGSAKSYAAIAIRVLGELKKHFPEQYTKNFRAPSEVLTLSGVRSFDTYYDLGEEISEKEVAELQRLLLEHNVLLIEETFLVNQETNRERRYSLVHMEALHDIPAQYGFAPEWTAPQLSNGNQSDFFLWWLLWQQHLNTMNPDKTPVNIQKWMRSSWFGHNMSFGMLLGYPGEAIASVLESEATNSFELTAADIKHANEFDGAHPVYDYHPELADNRNILAHQELWSRILDEVYSVI